MLIKPSVFALCQPISSTTSTTVHHLPSLTSSLRPSPPTCESRPRRQQQQQPQRRCQSTSQRQTRCSRSQCRYYATQREEKSQDKLPDWPRSPHPTPYEIFDIHRSAPYTKKRFYQLVKLYHPDKHHHHEHPSSTDFNSSKSSSTAAAAATISSSKPDISPSTRLERYRLVIAANDLLSSPSKRHLYDTHDIGWLPSDPSSRSNADLRRADRAWRHAPGSAAHNATWEDWERWHEANNPTAHGATNHSRTPLYMSNRMFASLVIIMCMVGAMAQKNRAESIGEEYVEWKAKKHAAIGAELGRRGMVTAGMGRDERVDAFVRERENANYHFAPTKLDMDAHK